MAAGNPRAEAIRQLIAAVNTGEQPGDEIAADAVIDLSRMRMEPAVYDGVAAWLERMADRRSFFTGAGFEIEGIVEEGDRILGLLTLAGLSGVGQVPVRARTAYVFDFDGDTITRLTYYDRDDLVPAFGQTGARLKTMLRTFSAYGAQDADAVLANLTPDIEGGSAFGGSARSYKGHDEARALLAEQFRGWEGLTMSLEWATFRGDVSLASVRYAGRGGASAASASMHAWFVTTWREDRVTGQFAYLDEDDARAALSARLAR